MSNFKMIRHLLYCQDSMYRFGTGLQTNEDPCHYSPKQMF